MALDSAVRAVEASVVNAVAVAYVADRSGISEAVAIDGTPVPVVFFSKPVARPVRLTPLNLATVGLAAVPARSPASWILPLVLGLASGVAPVATCPST